MYSRLLNPSHNHSFFLFGPRGVGKTTWIKSKYPKSLYIDLLQSKTYRDLGANPETLESLVPKNFNDFIIIDEIQKIPELLNEVHRLIESPNHYKFILTGSSARKLKHQGVNLLAGRAYLYNMYPLTVNELGQDFDLQKALRYGMLPSVYTGSNPEEYLNSYIGAYLGQEINQEGLTRNISGFYRFLEIASFSQGSPVNIANIASEVMVHEKVVNNYFAILEDLLVGSFLPPFTKRTKRRLIQKPKFYFFDAGIYNTARPKDYINTKDEIEGITLETLFLQHLKAFNDYYKLNYKFSYYRTSNGQEVDFILYGEKGFHAFEIKHSRNITNRHLRGLKAFAKDYPEAKLHVFYLGDRKMYFDKITAYPFEEGLKNLPEILKG